MSKFGIINWAVLVFYFIFMIWFGIHVGKKNSDTNEYFMGGRRIPWWAIGFSVIATQTSAVSFIGMPGWGYTSGLSRITFTIAFPLVAIILMMTVVPFFYNTRVVSIYEYLEKRFGRKSRVIGAFMFLISRGLTTGLVLYAPALALSVITGMDRTVAITIMSIIAIVYTLFGGIAAVVWTDVIQMVIVWIGVILAILIPINTIDGGIGAIIGNAVSNNFFEGFQFSLDLTNSFSFWGGLLGAGFLFLAYLGTDQSQIQRVLTAKSTRESKMSIAVAGFVVPIQTFLFLIAGICLFSLFGGKSFEKSDLVMLTFIAEYLPVGIGGLVTAGIFAAGMSSVDSALNSLATVSVRDFYVMYFNKNATDEQCLKMSRVFTLFWGIFAMGFAYVAGNLGNLLDVSNILGPLFYGAILGGFSLAILTKKGNEIGCIAAMLTGLISGVFLAYNTNIGSLWWSFISTVLAFAVGYIVSLLTSNKKQEVLSSEKVFDYSKATGSALCIQTQLELAIQGKIKEKDEDGYYIIPGKLDKISIVLFIYFIIQIILLLML